MRSLAIQQSSRAVAQQHRSRASLIPCRASLAHPHDSHEVPHPVSIKDLQATRRALVLTSAAWLLLPTVPWGTRIPKARAEEAAAAPAEFKKLKGYALPPDSYMGYEQNATYDVKYTIEYPADWKVAKPSKTEKSTMGMDTHVRHAKVEDVEAFVVALSGPDYRGAQLAKDPMDQLKAMATSDFDLRETLTEAMSSKTLAMSQGKSQGTLFYYYDVEGEKLHYLSAMTVDPEDGTMYALMVRAPAGRAFQKNEAALRRIQQSFTLV